MSVAEKVEPAEELNTQATDQQGYPKPYEPTDAEFAEAQRVLNVKKSKQRRVPKDLVERLKQVEPIEESALAGR